MLQLKAKDLEVSPENVRTTVNAAADEQLKADILAHGLLQNLLVIKHPERGYEVVGGGRRLRCIKALIKDGSLPADYEAACEEYDESKGREVSLAENVSRLAMHPVEEFKAYSALADKLNPADIAIRFGVTAQHVLGRMKLARLAEPVLKALESGKITLEQAKAFTVSNDLKRQARVLKETYDYTHANAIRRSLKEGVITANSPVGKLVGEKAYVDAGGKVEADIFGEDRYFENDELLRKLATEKLEGIAEKLRNDGWGWVLVITEGSVWQTTDKFGREHNDKPSKAAKALMGCVISIDHNGKPNVEKGFIKKEDQAKLKKAAPKSINTKAAPAGKEKGDMTQGLKDSLRKHRVQVMQAAVARKPEIAYDILLFNMVERLMKKYGPYAYGADIYIKDSSPFELRDTAAGKFVEGLRKELDFDWSKGIKKEGDLFVALTKVPADKKAKILAFCVALSLQPDLAEKPISPYVPEAMRMTGFNTHELWRPTKDNYFQWITTEQLLKVHHDIFGDKIKPISTKKGDLVRLLDESFKDPTKFSESREKLETWVPACMQLSIASVVAKAKKPEKKAAKKKVA